MRLLVLLAAAALAACTAPDETNRAAADAKTNETAAVPSATPPAPVSDAKAMAPAAADALTIPTAFQGRYDGSLAACAQPSDARLEIRLGEMRFHESIGTVRKVAIAAPDRVSVTADYQGEGERWQSVRELRLSDGGATLVVSGDGTSLMRRRCPPA
jgi:hypothetical protein